MKKLNLILVIAIFAVAQFGLSGCKKEKTTEDKYEDDHYFKAQIDGVSYSQKITTANGYIAGSSIGGTDIVNFTADISPDDENATTPSMSLTKGLMNNYLSSTNQQFDAFFSPGNYTYTTSPDYVANSGNGFSVDFKDNSGQFWSTEAGSGDQTNSKIKIVSVDEAESIINYYVSVKILFSCNLYNVFTGEKKVLKNGEFYGVFGKF